MSQLPDPSTLERFVCQDFDNASRFYVEQPEPVPRQISEYVVNPENWENVLPPHQRTVEGILSQPLQLYKCIFCWKRGRECWGEPCLTWWQTTMRRSAAAKIVLRDTGGPMGVGVFATKLIRRGTFLDDYVGELLPEHMWYPDDRYAFDLPGIGRCTSREYGNWTRFVNHRCRPNIRANDWMVGQRVVMMFRAIRDIRPGEQLFIEYGRGYFEAANRFCKCDVYPGDHLPPPDSFTRTDDPRSDDEMVPEQGRHPVTEDENTIVNDDSLLRSSSPEQPTSGKHVQEEPSCQQQQAKALATTPSTPKRNTSTATPKTPRAPRRKLAADEIRRGWRRPQADAGPAGFFLNVQQELLAQRTSQTPRRSTRVQTPKAPRRRRMVGPSGPVTASPRIRR